MICPNCNNVAKHSKITKQAVCYHCFYKWVVSDEDAKWEDTDETGKVIEDGNKEH